MLEGAKRQIKKKILDISCVRDKNDMTVTQEQEQAG
jgi:hypothetical protein